MNYIEELFSRQGALLRALSNTGSRRLAEESREGERSPSPASELWELAEEKDAGREAERLPAERKRSRAAGAPEPAAAPGAREETGPPIIRAPPPLSHSGCSRLITSREV